MTRIILILCLMMTAISVARSDGNEISFPSDYKETYVNYLNLDRVQNPDQIIRLYANKIASEGVMENGEYPDGSILIGEVYKARKNEAGEVIESSLGRRIIDKLALIAVMEKQKGWGDDFADHLKNGDWDFAAFKPDGTPADKDLDSCRACHSPLKDLRHVFSYEHMVK